MEARVVGGPDARTEAKRLSLARVMAWVSSRKGRTQTTGPKSSSCQMVLPRTACSVVADIELESERRLAGVRMVGG